MKSFFYRISIVSLVGGFCALAIFTLLFLAKTTPLQTSAPIDPEIFDNYGSLIGGFVGALFSLASILLLIHTIQEQKIDSQRQKIESRFFELLKIHRDNCLEMQLSEKTGKDTFSRMLRELRICIKMTNELDAELNTKYDEWKILNFAYLAFYFGSAEKYKSKVKAFIRNVTNYDSNFVEAFIDKCTNQREDIRKKEEFSMPLFSGHQVRLSHYFRHLFQTVSYIDKQPTSIISYEEKYDYIKTLRAQLSPQEQIILFSNSMSVLGGEWEKNYPNAPNRQLITKYNLIKNVFYSSVDPRKYYPCIEYEGMPAPECRKALLKQYD